MHLDWIWEQFYSTIGEWCCCSNCVCQLHAAKARNYGVTELEAFGVVCVVKHFHPYLYGHRYHVVTDHEELKSLLNFPHPSGKLARWGSAIQELDLHIHYHTGKVNQAAYALSRLPISDSPRDEGGQLAKSKSNSCSSKGWGGSNKSSRSHQQQHGN